MGHSWPQLRPAIVYACGMWLNESLCPCSKGAQEQQRHPRSPFSPDGRFLATAGAAGTVWIWELSSRQIVGSLAAHPEGPDYRENAQEWALGDIDWSSDGRYLVSCGRDPYTVKLWKVRIRV